MSAEDIKKRISLLDENQKWRLELLCRDDPIDDDHAPAHYPASVSSGTCRTWRLTGLAKMEPFTLEQFCPYLMGTASDEPEDGVEEETDTTEEDQEEDQDQSGLVVTDPGHHRIPAIMWALIGALALLALGFFFWPRISELISSPDDGFEPSVNDSGEIVAVAPTAEEIEVTRIVEKVVTSQPEVFIITATPPPLPTDTPGSPPTPSPTNTPLPPTATTDPDIATRTAIIFEDFSDGLLSEPFESDITPEIINGALMAVGDEPITITVGDEAWRNYTIEYKPVVQGGWATSGRLGIRAQDAGNHIQYAYGSYRNSWYLLKDHESDKIGTNGNYPAYPLKIDVNDHLITVFDKNNKQLFSYANQHFETGGLWIQIERGGIDEIKIVRRDG